MGHFRLWRLLSCCARGQPRECEARPTGSPPAVRQDAVEPPPTLAPVREVRGEDEIDNSASDPGTPVSLNHNNHFLPEWPTKEVRTDLSTNGHQSVAVVEKSSTVETTSVDETSAAPPALDGGVEKETAQYILRSILSDRHYDNILSSEDHSILQSIITTLDTTPQSTAVDESMSSCNGHRLIASTVSDRCKDDCETVSTITTTLDDAIEPTVEENVNRRDANGDDGELKRLTNSENFTVTEVVISEKKRAKIPKPAADDVKMNDLLILQAILSDGLYDISEEDRLALNSIIATLQTLTA